MFRLICTTGLLVGLVACSATKTTEHNLTTEDLAYIQSLGLLTKGEKIRLFASNGGWDGLKQSGNFISDRRVATYWVEDGKTQSRQALISTIDSFAVTFHHRSLTYASILTIYPHGHTAFELYVDADSLRVQQFADLLTTATASR